MAHTSHHFTWSPGGLSGGQIEYILRGYGIPGTSREWGGKMGYSVPVKQAKLAEYILCCARVPLTSPLLDKRNPVNAAARNYTMPPAWGVPVGAGDATGLVVDTLDKLFGGIASKPAQAFVASRSQSSKRRRKAGGLWATLKGLW